MTPARIRKRDGAEESFEELRLLESIEAALEAGVDNVEYGRQFVETVVQRLARRAEDPVESEQVARTVVEVLRAFGCGDAADAYSGYREQEQELVEGLRVHGQGGREERSAPWDRARLARSLVRDRYLEGLVARRVARRVERRAAMLGVRHLTGRLVAALADNECRTLGLTATPPSPERLGLDRRHMRAWLGGACLPLGLGGGAVPTLGPEAQDPRPALGEELLARFALEEVLTVRQRDAWEAGDFELLGLGDWLRPLCLRLRPGAEEEEEAFWIRVEAQRARAREVQVFLPARSCSGEWSRRVPRWLQAGPARLRLATADSALARSWSEQDLWHAMPAACFLDLPAAEREDLIRRGRTVLQWAPPQPRLPPPAERLCCTVDRGAVINLAAAARRAGAWQDAAFHQTVAEALEQASAAVAALAARAQADAYPRVALLPAGLTQALEILLPEAEARRRGLRRHLLALRDAFDRVPRRHGLRPDSFSPPQSEAAGARLADREGVEGVDALPIGWCFGLESVEMAGLAFDTAPWLELPAAEVHGAPWAARLQARPLPSAREAV